MSLLVSLLLKADAGQAKAELRALQTEVTKTGTTTKALDTAAKGGAAGVTALGNSAESAAADVQRLATVQTAAAGTADTLTRSNAMASGSVGNLVAQFNDVGMMMAAGQNPFMLAIQQGSQISQVLGPMGAAGAVKALGAAFLGMLSPVNLVVFAVIAGGATMVQWLFSAKEEALSLDDAMDGLSGSMEAYQRFTELSATSTAELTAKFGGFADEVRGFATYMQGVSLGQVLTSMDAAIDPLKGNLKDVVDQLREVADAQAFLDRTQSAFDQDLVGIEAVLNAQDVLDLLKAKAEETAEAMGLLPEQAAQLASAIDQLGAASGMAQIRDEAAEALSMIQQWYPAGAALPPELATAVTYLNEIVGQSAEATANTTSLSAAASALPGIFSAATGAAAGLAAMLAQGAAAAWSMAQGRMAAEAQLDQMAIEFSPGGQALTAYGSRGAPTASQQALETRNTTVSTAGSFQGGGGGSGGGGGGAAAAKAETDAVAELIAKLREEQQVLLETDPVQRELAKHRDVLADASATEREEIESLIAAEVQLKAVREASEFFGQTSLDFLKGISRGGEEAKNAIDNLLNSLLDVALQALWLGEGPLAGVLGISGGIFDSLFGVPGKAEGGMIYGDGGGTADKVPVMMSPGEFAVNARSTARYRPVLERINAGEDLPGFARGGMIGGAGYPVRTGEASSQGGMAVNVNLAGARGNAEIEEAVLRGVEAGLQLYRREGLAIDIKTVLRQRGRVTG